MGLDKKTYPDQNLMRLKLVQTVDLTNENLIILKIRETLSQIMEI